jgi:hypothetical protein
VLLSDFAEIYSVLEATGEYLQATEDAEAQFRRSPDYERNIAGSLKAHTRSD